MMGLRYRACFYNWVGRWLPGAMRGRLYLRLFIPQATRIPGVYFVVPRWGRRSFFHPARVLNDPVSRRSWACDYVPRNQRGA